MGSIPIEIKKIFSLPRVVPCFPLLELTPSGLFMGLSSTIIYTSELILCSTISQFIGHSPVMTVSPVGQSRKSTILIGQSCHSLFSQ